MQHTQCQLALASLWHDLQCDAVDHPGVNIHAQVEDGVFGVHT